MTHSTEASHTRPIETSRRERLHARLSDRWVSVGIPLLLVYARVVEGMVVSDHQLTLVRIAGLKGAYPSGSQGPLVNLEHWDAQWYYSIARHGYVTSHQAAFYPGYPLISDLLHWATFGSIGIRASLFTISWGALVGLAFIFVTFCRLLDISRSVSLVALFVVLFGPGSCFLISWYPLSLLLLTSCATFLCLFRQREWTSVLLCGAATSLSPVAVALSIALSVHFLFRHNSESLPVRLGKSIASWWGVVLYSLFCQLHYGSLFEPLRVQSDWYVKAVIPFSYLPVMIHSLFVSHYARSTVAFLGIDLLCQVVALAVVTQVLISLARKEISSEHLPFAVFTIMSLLIPASTVIPYGSTFKAGGFARLSGASIGFDVEVVRRQRHWALLVPFAALWFFLGLVGQILFSGGWFT